jgi:hypothetical protein
MSQQIDEQIKALLLKKFKTYDIVAQLKVSSRRVVQVHRSMEQSHYTPRLNSRERHDSFILNSY